MASSSLTSTAHLHPGARAVGYWLFMMAVLVAMMVVIGGITRLTGSGLSMVEWRPLMGVLPPLTEAEWMRVFGLYQQSPEYKDINFGMSLGEFKTIFFWEYVHRVWGRLLGVAFILPLIWFLARKMVPEGYGVRLCGLMILGGLQGVIGWWMVTSGLLDNPAVSQYRLSVHLTMALIIFVLLIWTGLNLTSGRSPLPSGHSAGSLVLLMVTIIAGAFVAGLDAGLLYNEYPLMGEGLVPVEYLEEGWADPFENPASAQFHHRWLAALTVLALVALAFRGYKRGYHREASLLGLFVCGQFALGLTTLLLGVPLWAGVMHQAGAVLLLGSAVFTAHRMSRG